MKRKTVKSILDILMTAALPLLMAYSLAGETLHEILGTAMLALFVTHHIINRRSTAAAFRGRQTPVRIANTVLNLVLFVVMILLPLSGVVTSKHVYTFLPTAGLAVTARTMHLLLSYLGFALMSLHLGFHADAWLNKLKSNKAAFVALAVIITLIAAYGAYVFFANRIYDYMVLAARFAFFDYNKPLILTLAQNASMIVLFAWLGYWVKELLKPRRVGSRPRHSDDM